MNECAWKASGRHFAESGPISTSRELLLLLILPRLSASLLTTLSFRFTTHYPAFPLHYSLEDNPGFVQSMSYWIPAPIAVVQGANMSEGRLCWRVSKALHHRHTQPAGHIRRRAVLTCSHSTASQTYTASRAYQLAGSHSTASHTQPAGHNSWRVLTALQHRHTQPAWHIGCKYIYVSVVKNVWYVIERSLKCVIPLLLMHKSIILYEWEMIN